MGKKTSNLLKVLAVVSLLCLGMANAAKADIVSSSSFTTVSGGIQFTNAVVWIDGYSDGTGTTYPFSGAPLNIPAFEPNPGNANPFSTLVNGFPAFVNATVIFGNSGAPGLSLAAGSGNTISTFSNPGTGHFFSAYTINGSGNADFGTAVLPPTTVEQYSGGTNDVCQASKCNNSDTVTLKQFGAATLSGGASGTYDIFSATDTSLGFIIAIPEGTVTTTTTTIPSTPEPSSLLMLGSGLLGLFGLGLRRKVEV